MLDELFPSASYQYVLYGMGFKPTYEQACVGKEEAEKVLQEMHSQREKLLAGLEPNRALLQQLLHNTTTG